MKTILTSLFFCTFSYSNAQNVGIGTTNPQATFSVGDNSPFRVDASGNIICINDVLYNFPATQGLAGQALQETGMDSLPGAGAEILTDRVRRLISKGKCGAQEWLDIMHEAHKLNVTTSATMMFGHVETITERFEHLAKIREVQSRKPATGKGFLAFIPWTFQDADTLLAKIRVVHNLTTPEEYIRMIALSRIMLPNVINIQASWQTVGKEVAQLCLQAGANYFGSIMIEENVVSAAGAPHRFTSTTIQDSIRQAGFEPQLRTQQYDWRALPVMEEQVIDY